MHEGLFLIIIIIIITVIIIINIIIIIRSVCEVEAAVSWNSGVFLWGFCFLSL